MRSLGKLVCQIPARGGSKRVPAKNLRYLHGKPMIAYAIECAQASGVFDAIYVNTDSDAIAALAGKIGASVYRRPAALGGDDATGDDFTADFLQKVACDTLAMISPVCPLLAAEDVQGAVAAFRETTHDTLISCSNTQMQTFCEGRAVNIDPDGPLAPSQQNRVVQILNWGVTIWESASFLERHRKSGSAYIGSNRLLFPIPASRSLKVTHEDDFRLAEQLLAIQQVDAAATARYWELPAPSR